MSTNHHRQHKQIAYQTGKKEENESQDLDMYTREKKERSGESRESREIANRWGDKWDSCTPSR